ncbi:hypothetical protein [Haloarcula sp. CBA1127]|uniref:hypothetical protein n=1 Tax=Haloarcula sp. CBA1127 TaxID=1765055 RepID=UPI00073ED481|nr:hypothetical protein [Haloarcula sp. CBA1127]
MKKSYYALFAVLALVIVAVVGAVVVYPEPGFHHEEDTYNPPRGDVFLGEDPPGGPIVFRNATATAHNDEYILELDVFTTSPQAFDPVEVPNASVQGYSDQCDLRLEKQLGSFEIEGDSPRHTNLTFEEPPAYIFLQTPEEIHPWLNMDVYGLRLAEQTNSTARYVESNRINETSPCPPISNERKTATATHRGNQTANGTTELLTPT